jgi:hypothetical protein
MTLQCSTCKKHLDEKQFIVAAKIENQKNWVGTGSLQSNTSLMEVRGGRTYLCKSCLKEGVQRSNRKLQAISGENIKRQSEREKRRYLRNKYIKEGYNKEEADHLSFDKIPYIWNEDGYIWSEEEGYWVKEDN